MYNNQARKSKIPKYFNLKKKGISPISCSSSQSIQDDAA